MLRKVPIIVILGSTGTGKTKLSIELAQRFGGEIISADSMQVYKGLNIATAKATVAEQSKAKHHLLDIAQPGKSFTVVDFRDEALPIVKNLLEHSKCPLIVGGTNYYIESLLWQVLVNPPKSHIGAKRKLSECDHHAKDKTMKTDSLASTNSSILTTMSDEAMNAIESAELHTLLGTVDPQMAIRLHPNNRRKIIRALEVYRHIGTPMSEIIQEQRDTPGGSHLGGPLRYDHVIIFWLQCEQQVLNDRLDARINDMVANGLLAEIRSFYDTQVEVNHTKTYTKGILQTIGFKEFIPYLEKYDHNDDNNIFDFIKTKSIVTAEPPAGLELLNSCLDELRLVTKRYSKKQLKWISNRFLSNSSRQVPPLYGLDTSTSSNWQKDVHGRAIDVVQSYIENRSPQLMPLEKHESLRAGLNEEVANVCEICNRHFVGEFQWKIHLKSNKHKRVIEKHKKTKQTEECSTI